MPSCLAPVFPCMPGGEVCGSRATTETSSGERNRALSPCMCVCVCVRGRPDLRESQWLAGSFPDLPDGPGRWGAHEAGASVELTRASPLPLLSMLPTARLTMAGGGRKRWHPDRVGAAVLRGGQYESVCSRTGLGGAQSRRNHSVGSGFEFRPPRPLSPTRFRRGIRLPSARSHFGSSGDVACALCRACRV
jgi:hypothetical protein